MYSKLNTDVRFFSWKSYDEIKQSINLETLPADEVNFQIYFTVRCRNLLIRETNVSQIQIAFFKLILRRTNDYKF